MGRRLFCWAKILCRDIVNDTNNNNNNYNHSFERHAPKKHVEKSPIAKSLNVLAYPISALIGYWFVRHDIRDGAYDAIKKDFPDRNDFLGQRSAVLKDAFKRIETGEKVDITQKMTELNREYSREGDAALEALGVNNMGKAWKFVHRGDHRKALMNGFTAAAIALGSLLAIANSKTVSEAFARQEEEEKKKDGVSL